MSAPVIKEIRTTLGYQCVGCDKTFEFPFDAYSHRCRGFFNLRNRYVAKTQLAEIRLETYEEDGTHSGIALSKPEPIEIIPDLVAMRRSVKNLIGNWS